MFSSLVRASLVALFSIGANAAPALVERPSSGLVGANAWPGTAGAYFCTEKNWGLPSGASGLKDGETVDGFCTWIPVFGPDCRRLEGSQFDWSISSFGPDKGLRCILYESAGCGLDKPYNSSSSAAPTSLVDPIPTVNVVTGGIKTVTVTVSVPYYSRNSTETTLTTKIPSIRTATTATQAEPTEGNLHHHRRNEADTASIEMFWPGSADLGKEGWDNRARSYRCFFD